MGPRILGDLARVLASAALAAVALCGCAAGGEELRGEVESLRAEVRTLQREAAETSRKMDALAQRVDLALARAEAPSARTSVRADPPAAAGASPASAAGASSSAAPPPPASAASTATGGAARTAAPLVPPDLKVVRLAPPAPARGPAPAAKGSSASTRGSTSSKGAGAALLPRKSPPPVSTDTPIREPDPGTLAALGAGGRDLSAEARSALQSARAQSGLARARALEQFTTGYSGHPSADDALVEAARAREQAGDPDGACEVLGRAVAEYPVGDAVPEALAGLAACESRRGRPTEARRLEARLLQDFPDSPAARSTRARAAAAQGAAP
jgi:TolA-binding protein